MPDPFADRGRARDRPFVSATGVTVVPLLVLAVIASTLTGGVASVAVPAGAVPTGAALRPPRAALVASSVSPVTYRPPIDAPIIDHFRPPPTPFAAGNRGVDFATVPGSPVRAMADGVVLFAGQVGGELHITILHADGLRTSSSYLASVLVVAGQRVLGGEVIGTTGEVLHVGVRDRDDHYLDPEALWRGEGGARLVPSGDDGAVPPDPAGEPEVLHQLLAEHRPRLADLRRFAHRLLESRPEVHGARVAAGMAAWYRRGGDCTPTGESSARPPGRRILIEVAGIGSTSDHAAVDQVDAAALGYDPGDVLRFSYAGGRVPRPAGSGGASGDLAALPATVYGAAASQEDLARAGALLDDLVQRVAVAAPGIPIDIVAHSQGGIVARLALGRAAAAGRVPATVQTLVTLGTPHRGADLAAVVAAGRVNAGGAMAEDGVAHVAGLDLDPTAPAARQLVAGSEVYTELERHPVPPSVRFTSIGARGDVVVTANRTVATGAWNTIVPIVGIDAHDRLPGSADATREIALAVGGRPPTCRGATQVAVDLAVSEQLSLVESNVAAGLGGGLVASGP